MYRFLYVEKAERASGYARPMGRLQRHELENVESKQYTIRETMHYIRNSPVHSVFVDIARSWKHGLAVHISLSNLFRLAPFHDFIHAFWPWLSTSRNKLPFRSFAEPCPSPPETAQAARSTAKHAHLTQFVPPP
jgi:hypothetical protein